MASIPPRPGISHDRAAAGRDKRGGATAMTDDGRDLAAESWAFALKLYAEPGVSDACLKLQADTGVDVMMLLVVTFAAAQRRILLTVPDIKEMDNECRPWREQVVRPLRALRTALKSGPAPAPSEATDSLRSQIKASELIAERLENDLLAAWLQGRVSQDRRLAREAIGGVMRDVVLQALGEERHHQIGSLQAAFDTLLSATDKFVQ